MVASEQFSSVSKKRSPPVLSGGHRSFPMPLCSERSGCCSCYYNPGDDFGYFAGNFDSEIGGYNYCRYDDCRSGDCCYCRNWVANLAVSRVATPILIEVVTLATIFVLLALLLLHGIEREHLLCIFFVSNFNYEFRNDFLRCRV